MFKLDNGEKVFPSILEDKITAQCIFIKNIYIFGGGLERPSALIFPNYELLNAKDFKHPDSKPCDCPTSVESYVSCLGCCLDDINQVAEKRFEQIENAIVIDKELTLQNGELTPSLKMVPRIVEKNYSDYINCLRSGEFDQLPADGTVVQIKR